ncbi:MAG: hypothetical protein L6R43_16690 [Planctomycetes bacterium]|nr:hypothetical protein [Planctomycetota bacterium]
MEDEAVGARVVVGVHHGAGVPLRPGPLPLERAVVQDDPVGGNRPLHPDLQGEVLAHGDDAGGRGVEADDDEGGPLRPGLVEEEEGAAGPDPGLLAEVEEHEAEEDRRPRARAEGPPGRPRVGEVGGADPPRLPGGLRRGGLHEGAGFPALRVGEEALPLEGADEAVGEAGDAGLHRQGQLLVGERAAQGPDEVAVQGPAEDRQGQDPVDRPDPQRGAEEEVEEEGEEEEGPEDGGRAPGAVEEVEPAHAAAQSLEGRAEGAQVQRGSFSRRRLDGGSTGGPPPDRDPTAAGPGGSIFGGDPPGGTSYSTTSSTVLDARVPLQVPPERWAA